jgi:hypothetical protein
MHRIAAHATTHSPRPCVPHLQRPRSSQPVPPRGRMLRRGSLGVHAERCSTEPWPGSVFEQSIDAGAVAIRVREGGQSRYSLPSRPLAPRSRHDLRYCPHPPPACPFPRPDGCAERRSSHPPRLPRRFRVRASCGERAATARQEAAAAHADRRCGLLARQGADQRGYGPGLSHAQPIDVATAPSRSPGPLLSY